MELVINPPLVTPKFGNLWAFGFKASFDTGIEETEETAVA